MSSWDFLPPSWRTSQRSPARATRAPNTNSAPTTSMSADPLYAKPTHSFDDPETPDQEGAASVSNVCAPTDDRRSLTTSEAELRKQVSALEHEVVEKRWAVARAVELSETLAETQRALHVAQERLHAQEAQLRAHEERTLELTKLLTEAQTVQRSLNSRGGCLNCLLHREAETRQDLVSDQQAARYVLELEWASYASSWQFAERQCAETELEQMWLEDQRAHALAIRQFQAEMNKVDDLKATIRSLKKECDHSKAKYRDLKEKGRAHIEELKAAHEENMRRARSTYLRCNPNQAVLMWSLGKARQSIKTAFDVGAQLGHSRKELWILREQLSILKATVRQSLAALSADVQGALRICLPVMWKPSAEIDMRTATPPRSKNTTQTLGLPPTATRLPSPTTHQQQASLKPRGRSPPVRPARTAPVPTGSTTTTTAVVAFHAQE